jgi:CofD-related protein of GAK system
MTADRKSFLIRRSVTIPDKLKIARCQHAPGLGPRLLFFSGGTALRGLSQEIIQFTHNTIHLITAFDSGGSSAEIRRVFNMISIGDLRNRLMALADQSIKGNPDIYRLFLYRFDQNAEQAELVGQLRNMIAGGDPLIDPIAEPMKSLICNQLRFFFERMPYGFDLCGANIGNLILAGGFINNGDRMDVVLFLFSKLVEVRGLVRPVSDSSAELTVQLEDGRILTGQRQITGKEVPPLTSPVRDIWLSDAAGKKIDVRISPDTEKLISRAEMICYPMGSFYSSLIAALLPLGFGPAVAANPAPKIYIPNTSHDPEQGDLSVADQIAVLLRTLRHNDPIVTGDLLNYVLIDSENGQYPADCDVQRLEEMGLGVIDVQLVSQLSAPYIDPRLLTAALLSLT